MQSISAYAGARKDYVQGGGGNTSVKFDDRLMAIKASGYALAEITDDTGYITVDYPKIKQYYSTVNPELPMDYESESLGVNLDSIVLLDGMEQKRPSVEVGFHSFLKKCVIHTHAVYANILCCSEEGRALAEEILKKTGICYVFIPYIDPGFHLTLAIKKEIEKYEAQKGVIPDAIFLENHGFIAHADSSLGAITVHDIVNQKIKLYLHVNDFPVQSIIRTVDGFKSDTAYLKDFIRKNNVDEGYFNALKLYPDQLVYIGDKMGHQIRIKNGQAFYSVGQKEAQTIEETLVAIAYIVDAIKKAGLTLRQMDEKGADFIINWESEKYRSSLVSKES